MYIKFVMSASIEANYSYGKYFSINGFKLYDSDNNIITDLNSVNNLIYQNYNYRNDQAATDLWFNPTTGSRAVPCMNPTVGTSATIIIRIDNVYLKKIDLIPYSNGGGAKYVDIYYSLDNINYIFSEKIIFTSINEIITTIKFISIFMALIQDGNNICNTDGTLLSIIDSLPYTIEAFNTYGINTLSLINPTVIDKIINDKFNIAILK